MACATLKRTLDFDPLHSPRSPKRRRCIPMTISPSTPPTKQQSTPSPFTEATPKITSEEIAAKISAEVKRMQRRKQLQYPSGCNSPPPSTSQLSSSQDHENVQSPSGSSSFFNALSPGKKDVPLFTFRQVSFICDRMIKDREAQIKAEYEKVLSCKLAEQYEAFLKFNHDQIQRRFQEQPVSYVS